MAERLWRVNQVYTWTENQSSHRIFLRGFESHSSQIRRCCNGGALSFLVRDELSKGSFFLIKSQSV